ncbi:hypothetical protein [Phascolarctobacterium faecium]|uniref:hypothetical protein n=1 Tax=Phascolarctobacterium faecium TaxID=33025 RepID=UPI003FEFCE77
MKKILNLMMLSVLAVCFALPVAGKAEAAKMAVVPLTNHVEENTTASMIYMDEVMAMFKFPEFDMVADDVVEKAVGTTDMVDFSKANLERIARESGADIVVAMSLDTLDDKALFPRREPTLKLDMSGEFAFLNKVTGRYYAKKYSDDMEIEEALTVRSDWKSEEFAKTVRSYLKKVNQVK